LKQFVDDILIDCPESSPFCATPLSAYNNVVFEDPSVFQINSGVLVITPREGWTEKLVSLAKNYHRRSLRPPSAEQEFLNEYLANSTELTYISPKFNCQPRGTPDCYIHHFLGSISIEELLFCKFIEKEDYSEVLDYSWQIESSFEAIPPCDFMCNKWAPMTSAYANCYGQMQETLRSEQFLEAHRLSGFAYAWAIGSDPVGLKQAACMLFNVATCRLYLYIFMFVISLKILLLYLKRKRRKGNYR